MRSGGGAAAMPVRGKTDKKPIETRRKSMNRPMKDRYPLHPSFLVLRMTASFYPHKVVAFVPERFVGEIARYLRP